VVPDTAGTIWGRSGSARRGEADRLPGFADRFGNDHLPGTVKICSAALDNGKPLIQREPCDMVLGHRGACNQLGAVEGVAHDH
jgi:hypothetical protein